jgi:hypothetical protein
MSLHIDFQPEKISYLNNTVKRFSVLLIFAY